MIKKLIFQSEQEGQIDFFQLIIPSPAGSSSREKKKNRSALLTAGGTKSGEDIP